MSERRAQLDDLGVMMSASADRLRTLPLQPRRVHVLRSVIMGRRIKLVRSIVGYIAKIRNLSNLLVYGCL